MPTPPEPSRPGDPRPGGFLERLAAPGRLDDRVMVVVAHPDDETIGIGGQLPRLEGACVVHLTDGAPADMTDARSSGFTSREAYAAARRRELEAAMAVAGLGPERLLSIAVPDQAVSRRMPELVGRLLELLRRHRPSVVVTHAYEGGHPDHDAAAFVVHAAGRLLAGERAEPPVLVEMPLYHSRHGAFVTQAFAAPPSGGPAPTEIGVRLSGPELALKQRMLAAHVTQAQTLAPFRSPVERFRTAPAYDFRALPNGGEVHYDRFTWNLTSREWPLLAAEACRELGLPPCL